MTRVAAQHAQHAAGDSLSSRYYRPELDVLRFFAFLMVFASHAVPGDPAFYDQLGIAPAAAHFIVALAASGAFGVDLFFALSSFLITTLLIRERETFGAVDVSSFYLRRVLRILPLYFAFLLVVTPIVDPWLAKEGMPTPYVFAFVALIGNWACSLWGYPSSVAGPLWSVSIEEQFYLIWPWVMQRVRRFATIAIVFLTVSFVTRWLLVSRGAVHPEIWCNTLARLDPIACGALLATVAHRRTIDLSFWMRAVLLMVSIALLAALGRYGDFAGSKALLTFPIATLACVLVLLCAVGSRMSSHPGPVLRMLVYLGRISYGLYVFHLMFVFAFDVTSTGSAPGRIARNLLAFSATIAAAALSYQFFEMRFLRLKERVTRIKSRPCHGFGRNVLEPE